MSKKSKAQWTVSTFFGDEDGRKKKEAITSKSKKENKSNVIPFGCMNNYEPQTLSDLALTNIRIQNLECWFKNLVYQQKRGRILLLTGPVGCGKTAAIRVMAKERQYDIIDWVLPDIIEYTDASDESKGSADLNAFREFLRRAGRYPQIGSSIYKKFIIVEDLPDSIISQKDDFYNILRNYVASALIPLVIIHSHTDPNNLLSTDLKMELKIDTVMFKTVPETCIKKALNRVLLIHGLPAQKFTREISLIKDTCGGNLRKAISELLIYMIKKEKSTSDRVKLQSLGKEKLYIEKLNKIKPETGIFHSIGRVLHAKRHAEASTSKSTAPLLHDPIEIVEQYAYSHNQFVSLLHNNYLDIYSTMESIASASDYLSDYDIITAEWREKEGLEKIGFAVAVCGMMMSSYNPVKKWKPLSSSTWMQERTSLLKIHEDVKEEFPEIRSLGVEIHTDFLPVFKTLSKKQGIYVKQCKFQFTAHEASDLISGIRKWRTNSLSNMPQPNREYEDEDDDDDYQIIEDSE